jgi:hypothetical protein
MSHVSGITGVRHIIDGNTEYNGYSWPICGWTWNAIGGWTSNSGLNPTVASWAIAAEAKMSIDPAARANCTDFGIVFLRKGTPAGVEGWSWGFSINRDDSACAKTHPGTVDTTKGRRESCTTRND